MEKIKPSTPEQRAERVMRRLFPMNPDPTTGISYGYFLREIQEAVAEEREACAKLVETWAQDHLTIQPSFTGMAAAIRGRNE
jgi:hypothetical protein